MAIIDTLEVILLNDKKMNECMWYLDNGSYNLMDNYLNTRTQGFQADLDMN